MLSQLLEEHQNHLADLNLQHDESMARAEHDHALELNEHSTDAQEKLRHLEAQYEYGTATLRAQHAKQQRAEFDLQLEALSSEHAELASAAHAEHETELQTVQSEFKAALAQSQSQREQELSAELAQQAEQHQEAVAELSSNHATELEREHAMLAQVQAQLEDLPVCHMIHCLNPMKVYVTLLCRHMTSALFSMKRL